MSQTDGDLERWTVEVVRAVNERHGTAFSLARRLPGGFQEGAYELRSDEGRAVLKWNRRSTPAARLAEVARLLSIAAEAGWPSPAWRYYGVTATGERYVVQQYVVGEHRTTLDDYTLDLLIAVNRSQAGLNLPTEQEWSRYANEVVFNNRYDFLERVVTFSAAGAEFRRLIEALCAGAKSVQVPNDDLVCGVFSLENILFNENRVAGVIDVAAIGRGCRAFDLAVLYSRLPSDAGGSTVERRLRAEGESVAGPAVFRLCLVAEILGVLSFGVDHWPQNVSSATTRWTEQLRTLV